MNITIAVPSLTIDKRTALGRHLRNQADPEGAHKRKLKTERAKRCQQNAEMVVIGPGCAVDRETLKLVLVGRGLMSLDDLGDERKAVMNAAARRATKLLLEQLADEARAALREGRAIMLPDGRVWPIRERP
jgi:hypothetical protein